SPRPGAVGPLPRTPPTPGPVGPASAAGPLGFTAFRTFSACTGTASTMGGPEAEALAEADALPPEADFCFEQPTAVAKQQTPMTPA
ncbi:MAG TPA: hypothetical protein PKD61_19035, partial [Polyangiaceae bacterium]|nr:hypothetical protein [Polyangiaceae bacterium]